jgi:hypothetical protein
MYARRSSLVFQSYYSLTAHLNACRLTSSPESNFIAFAERGDTQSSPCNFL